MRQIITSSPFLLRAHTLITASCRTARLPSPAAIHRHRPSNIISPLSCSRHTCRTCTTSLWQPLRPKTRPFTMIRETHGSSHQHVTTSSSPSTVAASAFSAVNSTDKKPTGAQLRRHFYWEAVPMIAFGFIDQTILINAGNAIDCTLGVMFGLSTLTAAAIGSIISMVVGLAIGGTVERTALQLGLPATGLTAAQRSLPIVHRIGFYGTLAGAMLGCSLGMINLFFVDTHRSEILKLQALTQDQELAFEVEASNRVRPDATAVTVKGPDVDGILASMTAALSAAGYSVVELHASSRDEADESIFSEGTYEDICFVRPRGAKEKVPDDELDDLAHTVLAACKDPLSSHSLKAQVMDLREDNEALIERVAWLERALEERQVKIVKGAEESSTSRVQEAKAKPS